MRTESCAYWLSESTTVTCNSYQTLVSVCPSPRGVKEPWEIPSGINSPGCVCSSWWKIICHVKELDGRFPSSISDAIALKYIDSRALYLLFRTGWIIVTLGGLPFLIINWVLEV